MSDDADIYAMYAQINEHVTALQALIAAYPERLRDDIREAVVAALSISR
jgi:hypothetical protein